MKHGMAVFGLVAMLCGTASAQDVGPISHESVIDGPLEQVWAAFTTTDGLRAWLAPHVDIDLRVGGLMRTNYNAQGRLGDPQTIENAILSFEPQRMISIKVAKAPANFPFPNAIHAMWTVLYFSPAGPNQTTVREVSMGFTSDPESQKMRAFFNHGNSATLSQLQRHFARRN